MNERIKALMLKAGGVLAPAYVTDADDNSVWTENAKVDTIDMDAEYFAKLLLKECMTTVLKESKWYWDKDEFESSNAIQNAVRRLNEHFGAV